MADKTVKGMRKVDRCDIYGRKLPKNYFGSDGVAFMCNAAVVGDVITIQGHRTCINNVDNKVVLPNRLAVIALQSHKG